jgi:ATP-dependent protease ClpP protease subunit
MVGPKQRPITQPTRCRMRSAWVIALLLIAVTVCAPRAEASVVTVQGCESSGDGWTGAAHARPAAGTIVDIQIGEDNRLERGGFHHLVQICRNFQGRVFDWPRFRIEGPIRPFMADIFDVIHNEIMNNPRTRRQFDEDLSKIIISINSDGGDIAAAMRIGRRLRALNSSIVLNFNDNCHSACMVILASGIKRSPFGRVGIHRPHFVALDHRETRQQVTARLNRLNAELAAYFQEMGQPASMLDAMRAVPPDQIRILSPAELQHFMLSGDDPAYEERDLARQAHQFGTTSSEMRRRIQLANQICGMATGSTSQIQRWTTCNNAIMYAVTEQTLQARANRAVAACRHITRGRPIQSLDVDELRSFMDCRRDIMVGNSR